MRKGHARQVRTVSQDGRLSLFQVEPPPLPASHQAKPVYSPSACDEVAPFYPSSSRYLQMLKVGWKPRGLISVRSFNDDSPARLYPGSLDWRRIFPRGGFSRSRGDPSSIRSLTTPYSRLLSSLGL